MRVATIVLMAGLCLTGARADDPPKGWDFLGVTRAAATVEVRGRVTGELTRIAVKAGDTVAKGDALVEIDTRPYQLAVNAATARVKAAEARLSSARIQTANAKSLLERKAISPKELALHEATEAEAEAGLAVAKAELEQAQLTLAWTHIAAPFAGRVSHVLSSEGSLVVAHQTHILTVMSIDPMTVSFNVPESMAISLRRKGHLEATKLDIAVGFADEKGNPHNAKLDLIEPEVNRMSGNVRFQATIPNPDGVLLPGMSVRVHVTPPGE